LTGLANIIDAVAAISKHFSAACNPAVRGKSMPHKKIESLILTAVFRRKWLKVLANK
jgi:hypothetical protein